MRPRAIEVLRGDNGDIAVAKLVSGLGPSHLELVEGAWSGARVEMMMNLTLARIAGDRWPQSLHWDWARKGPALRLLQATGLGITCGDEWQGVMLTLTAEHVTRLGADAGKPIVYIEFLETAPWNWRIAEIGQTPRFRGVGSVLFREAVRQSTREGFRGRVGLHALSQSEHFYERACGMTRMDPDPKKLGLVYFELPANGAAAFLSASVRE